MPFLKGTADSLMHLIMFIIADKMIFYVYNIKHKR